MRRLLTAGGLFLFVGAAVISSLLMGMGSTLHWLTPLANAGDTITPDTVSQTPDTMTQSETNGSTKPTLKDELSKGLKARRPEEFAFVNHVVSLVDHGHLSRDLVEGTFLWARGKPAHQFQYFEMALKERAKKAGISL